jgi:tellurite resistance protein
MEAMRKVEILRAACCVAGIDGETDEKELAVLRDLAEEVGVGQTSLGAMIERAENDQAFYQEQFRVLKADPKETLKLLLSVALADGRLGNRESQVLKLLALRLDVDGDQFDRWFDKIKHALRSKRQ